MDRASRSVNGSMLRGKTYIYVGKDRLSRTVCRGGSNGFDLRNSFFSVSFFIIKKSDSRLLMKEEPLLETF